jgi:hypothetical protein
MPAKVVPSALANAEVEIRRVPPGPGNGLDETDGCPGRRARPRQPEHGLSPMPQQASWSMMRTNGVYLSHPIRLM